MRWAFGQYSMVPMLAPWLTDKRPHLIAFEVRQPVLMPSDRQSDELDAMIWPTGDPSNAIVIEGKRLRVDGDTVVTHQIGGLSGIIEGAHQVRAHVQRGFSRVYLAVFVEVDSRTYSGGHWIGGGLPWALSKQVIDSVETPLVDDEVGILVFEVDQPVDSDVLLSGGFGLRHSRVAPHRRQPDELTNRVRQFIDTIERPTVMPTTSAGLRATS